MVGWWYLPISYHKMVRERERGGPGWSWAGRWSRVDVLPVFGAYTCIHTHTYMYIYIHTRITHIQE